METYAERTPLSVGSPQQVIEKTLEFQDMFGDYQRQLWVMDHAGLPLKTVLEQLELLGGEVVPVLRKEFAARRSPHAAEAPDARAPGPAEVRRHSSPASPAPTRTVVTTSPAPRPIRTATPPPPANYPVIR